MKAYTLGLYEKAMPSTLSWEERLAEAKNAGFDFVEISIDETDAKLARLDWTAAERLELLKTMDKVGLPIRSMCLSGHRKYPLGSPDAATRARSMEIMEKAIALGFDCILTSGQQATALQGIPLLEQLVQRADGRIDILAGSGVSPENIPALAQKGIRCFHFSAKKTCESPMIFRKEGVPMGLPVADEYLRQYTSKDLVQAAQKLLESL